MELIINTENGEYAARQLWHDSKDSFIEAKLDEIENSEEEFDYEAVMECYKHFHEIYGDATPRLDGVSEDKRIATISFPSESWTITCFLR